MVKGKSLKLNLASEEIQQLVLTLYSQGSPYTEIERILWEQKKFKVGASSIQRWLKLQPSYESRSPSEVSQTISKKPEVENPPVDLEIGDLETETLWTENQLKRLMRLSLEALDRGLINHLERDGKYPSEASRGLIGLFGIAEQLSKKRQMRNLLDFQTGLSIEQGDLTSLSADDDYEKIRQIQVERLEKLYQSLAGSPHENTALQLSILKYQSDLLGLHTSLYKAVQRIDYQGWELKDEDELLADEEQEISRDL